MYVYIANANNNHEQTASTTLAGFSDQDPLWFLVDFQIQIFFHSMVVISKKAYAN